MNKALFRQAIVTLIIGLAVISFGWPISFVHAASNETGASTETSLTENIDIEPDENTEPDKLYDGLDIDLTAPAAIVIETGRQRVLFEKNSDVKMSIPTASKLMTALIACERLPLDTMVTISSVAASQYDAANSPDYVELGTGDKYMLEYLLLRILYYDSDSAAIAVAEQIANEESRFVELMNSRAQSYDMINTFFMNSTGEPVVENVVGDINSIPKSNLLQYSTAADVARLINAGLQNQNFSELLSRRNDQLIINGEKLVPMRNQAEAIWTLSEGAVTGAFNVLSQGQHTMVTSGTKDGINIITVTASTSEERRYTDTLNLYNGISEFYELSPLARAGDLYAEDFERTIDGETFGLVFSKTVYYIHPIGDDFLMSNVQYKTYGPHSRPIQRSMVVGQVIFQMRDGTSIAVDVAPDRQILSTITILDRGLDQLQRNPNLTLVIIGTLFSFVLLLLWQFLRAARETIHLIVLVILDKKTRKL
ncbi:MAG: D-alanyl-D-alanine carboxypeptidase [Clostridiaceae bacterium]|nr:D-alanyl-D-alanine carboxypeptidase [Clostridiaceae bacterium]